MSDYPLPQTDDRATTKKKALADINRRLKIVAEAVRDLLSQNIQDAERLNRLENTVGHHILDMLMAIEKKVGVDNSEDENSLDYRITQLERRHNVEAGEGA